jgi:hypothetical protein
MKGKIYTVEEANKTLPLIKAIIEDVKRTYEDISVALAAYEMAQDRGIGEQQMAAIDAELSLLLESFDRLIKEVENLGAAVKDYEHGFVDFYSELNGRIVYLCWAPGEDHIQYWHKLEDNRLKRRKLPIAISH